MPRTQQEIIAEAKEEAEKLNMGDHFQIGYLAEAIAIMEEKQAEVVRIIEEQIKNAEEIADNATDESSNIACDICFELGKAKKWIRNNG